MNTIVIMVKVDCMKQEVRRGIRDIVVVSENILFDKNNRTVYVSKPRLAPEDLVAFKFSSLLEELRIKYVVVAGYVAILFGRARRSDDIDFIVGYIDEEKFLELCSNASKKGFTLMQGEISLEDSVRRIYKEYLAKGYSIRFMYKDTILPNIEFRVANTDLHNYVITNSLKVVVNNEYIIKISSLEIQIAYKLYLGSDKDIGDAIFLYNLFKEIINHGELYRWCSRLGVECKILEE